MVGFVEGEGSFMVILQKSLTNMGTKLSLRFSISQHSRDLILINSFIAYFGCGSVVQHGQRSTVEFIVTKFSDINEKIIPFFIEHPLQGIKKLNCSDFSEVAELMKNKSHLNLEGLQKIKQIQEGMNKKRRNFNSNSEFNS